MDDEIVVEEPLEIRVRGRAISITMRTPGHDEDLALGFLLGEGVIRAPADVLRVEPCARDERGNRVDVLLAPQVHVDFERLTRHVFASSSCGICGSASIESIARQFPPVADGVVVDADVLHSLPGKMREVQWTFQKTGSLHAAAVFDRWGNILAVREDVGRHNAVDKALGQLFREGLVPLRDTVLMVSGRASFEIIQKALSAGVPVVASVSGPSTLAVDLSRRSGQTLAGFVRDGRMNVYAGAPRIIFGGEALPAEESLDEPRERGDTEARP